VIAITSRRLSRAHIENAEMEEAVRKIFMLFAIEFLLVAGTMSMLVIHAHSVRISSHT
jgi:hypothetical protein